MQYNFVVTFLFINITKNISYEKVHRRRSNRIFKELGYKIKIVE